MNDTSLHRTRAAARPVWPAPREWVVAGAILAFACYVAHFLYVRRFGLYEDDYIYTLGCFDWSLGHWWGEAVKAIVHPVQGRPLNHLVRRTLNFVLLRGDTLLYAHLASWVMLSVNASLLYALARRHLGALAALAAALLYLLYPADASRQILMHQSDLLFGTMLCLGGLLAFSSERTLLGWFFGLCCLLNYESFYLPLIVGPLLAGGFSLRRDWKRLLRHAAAFAAVAAAVVIVRGMLGDDRARGLAGGGAESAALRGLAALVIGPLVSLRAGVVEPLRATLGAGSAAWLGGLAVALGVAGGLAWAGRAGRREPGTGGGRTLQVAVAGALAWPASYGLCIRPDNFPPTAVIGRLSGVHVAGSVGAALLAGALVEFLATRVSGRRARMALATAAAAAFGLMVVRGIRIQRDDYVTHWREQQRFWTRLVSLVPDLRDGEPVLLDIRGPAGVFPETPGFPRFGLVNYAPVTLHRIIRHPADWKVVPRVFCLYDGCPAYPQADGVLLKTPFWFWDGLWPVVQDGHFILLCERGGRLVRSDAPVDLAGRELHPRPLDPGVHTVAPNRLMRALYERQSHAGD